MFGYVRPLKGELKVREYEEFKAAYCGLCHALRHSCGLRARFIVNYDFVFLAMLLSEKKIPEYRYRRCIASPFRKKCFAINDPALNLAADYSVILTYWKLRDSIHDGGILVSMTARVFSLLLRGAYRRAARRNFDFDGFVRDKLRELSVLERENCASIDRVADTFSLILASASSGLGTPERRRILYQALYHVGRAVYIMDAADDFEDDLNRNVYNVLLNRFDSPGRELDDGSKAEIRLTVTHSVNQIISAFGLLDTNAFREILENIITLGIPHILDRILRGEWRQMSKNRKNIDKTE